MLILNPNPDGRVYAKKEGDVCTVYLSPTGVSQRIPNFESAPPGFPQTLTIDELRSRVHADRLVLVEAPPEPERIRPEPSAEVRARVAAAIQKMDDQIKAKQAARNPAPPAAAPAVDIQALLVNAFKLYAAEARAEKKTAAIATVGEFLVNAFPDYAVALEEAAKAPKRVAFGKKRSA